MRPLNKKESSSKQQQSNNSSSNNRAWKVLTKHNAITQVTSATATTATDNSSSNSSDYSSDVRNNSSSSSFFQFDKTFGEDSTTTEVYDGIAKEIVQSVVLNGVHGTIFAYGQTSSGKTFTMQGLNNHNLRGGKQVQAKAADTVPGIIHMAARDIFQHIEDEEKKCGRNFTVRVSFIEIYNEEVRDLSSPTSSASSTTNKSIKSYNNNKRGPPTLKVREDPQRGPFVNAHETIVQDFTSLLDVLFDGQKNRSIASTGMNERSSRSHTIFRITIESRMKKKRKRNQSHKCNTILTTTTTKKSDEDTEDGYSSCMSYDDYDYKYLSTMTDDDYMLCGTTSNQSNNNYNDNDNEGDEQEEGTFLSSTLNLVDLAGSESVRYTGATGDRMKEGAKINQR